MRQYTILSVVILALAAGVAPGYGMTVRVGPACGGMGFEGTAKEGETAVRFKSCASKEFCYVRIWKASGEPLTAMLRDGMDLKIWMGGIELSKNMTEEQARRVQEALKPVQAEWDTARCLFDSNVIRELGLDKYEDARSCFLGHGQAYEGKSEHPCSPLVPEE
jgi:hypothetical protein